MERDTTRFLEDGTSPALPAVRSGFQIGIRFNTVDACPLLARTCPLDVFLAQFAIQPRGVSKECVRCVQNMLMIVHLLALLSRVRLTRGY